MNVTNHGTRTGYNKGCRCQPCTAANSAKSAAYYAANRKKIAAAAKRARSKDPEKHFALSRARTLAKYGLTEQEYNSLLYSQAGVCAICKQPETSKDRNGRVKLMAVDHCHSTGRVRGLLCGRCNKGLGLFLDDREYLASAIRYLGG